MSQGITFSGALANAYDMVRNKAKQAKQTIKGLINHFESRINCEKSYAKSLLKSKLPEFPTELTSFRVALTIASANIQEQYERRIAFIYVLQTKVVPPLTDLLSELRKVKAKLETEEKRSKRGFESAQSEYQKLLKSSPKDAEKLKNQSMENRQQNLSFVLATFEDHERNRLKVIQELLTQAYASEKELLGQLQEANYAMESCLLATNVEADMVELIMSLNQQQRERAQSQAPGNSATRGPADHGGRARTAASENREASGEAVTSAAIVAPPPESHHLTPDNMFDLKAPLDVFPLRGWELHHGTPLMKLVTLMYLQSLGDAPAHLSQSLSVMSQLSLAEEGSPLTLRALVPQIGGCDHTKWKQMKDLRLWLRARVALAACAMAIFLDTWKKCEERDSAVTELKQYCGLLDFLLSDKPIGEDFVPGLAVLPSFGKYLALTFKLFSFSAYPFPRPLSVALFSTSVHASLSHVDDPATWSFLGSLRDHLDMTAMEMNAVLLQEYTGAQLTEGSRQAAIHRIDSLLPSFQEKFSSFDGNIERIPRFPLFLHAVLPSNPLPSPIRALIVPVVSESFMSGPTPHDLEVIDYFTVFTTIAPVLDHIRTRVQKFFESYFNGPEELVSDIEILKSLASLDDSLSGITHNVDEELSQYMSAAADAFHGRKTPETVSSLLDRANRHKHFLNNPRCQEIVSVFDEYSPSSQTFFAQLRSQWREDVKKVISLGEVDTESFDLLELFYALQEVDSSLQRIFGDKETLMKTFPFSIQTWLDQNYTSMRAFLTELTEMDTPWYVDEDDEEDLAAALEEDERADRGSGSANQSDDSQNPDSARGKSGLSSESSLGQRVFPAIHTIEFSRRLRSFHINIDTIKGGRPLCAGVDEAIEKSFVELTLSYLDFLDSGNDGEGSHQQPLPPFPTSDGSGSSKRGSWAFGGLFGGGSGSGAGGKHKGIEYACCEFDPNPYLVRLSSLAYLSRRWEADNGMQGFLTSLGVLTQKDFSAVSDRLASAGKSTIRALAVHTIYHGAGDILLSHLYVPTYEESPLSDRLLSLEPVLASALEKTPESFKMELRKAFFETVAGLASRVLLRSGQPRKRDNSSWEFQSSEDDDSFLEFGKELCDRIEKGYAEGNRTLKAEVPGHSVFQLDLTKQHALDVINDNEVQFRIQLLEVFKTDLNYLQNTFGANSVSILGGIPDEALQGPLSRLEETMRWTLLPSQYLVGLIQTTEDEESKRGLVSIIKHRLGDPRSVRIASTYQE